MKKYPEVFINFGSPSEHKRRLGYHILYAAPLAEEYLEEGNQHTTRLSDRATPLQSKNVRTEHKDNRIAAFGAGI